MVGDTVGESEGAKVGEDVGELEGSTVGDTEGKIVGLAVIPIDPEKSDIEKSPDREKSLENEKSPENVLEKSMSEKSIENEAEL
mmetsp:Transcript_191/g.337  ORF Transcript_191/g.337 Transcript_191/m.337 type:complete len:84 (+) Transcript_191:1443-1694(+)